VPLRPLGQATEVESTEVRRPYDAPVRAIVVGAGAVGAACAWYLVEEGCEVTLVDRGEVGRGCSYANAGLICPAHSEALPGPGIVAEGLRALLRRDGPFAIRPQAGPSIVPWLLRFWRQTPEAIYRRSTSVLVELSRLSFELHEELVRRGVASFGYRRGPLLAASRDRGWRHEAEAVVEEVRGLGFGARVLERDDLLGLEPALAPDHLGGYVLEDQGSGDSYRFVRSLVEHARSRGAAVLERTPVRRILVREGRAVGVLAGEPPREIAAELVVLAAGAWSPALARGLGLRLPIQPATGYSLTLPAWEGAPRLPIIAGDSRVIVLPLEGRVRFAGTLELAGFRREPDPVRARAVLRAGLGALREPPPVREPEPWFGFRPLVPDDLPLIGWAPGVRGVLVATGHGTLGFTQGPATGKLIAELAAGKPPSLPLEPFRPDRF
jgi:D-amino-acid dehydrogenase